MKLKNYVKINYLLNQKSFFWMKIWANISNTKKILKINSL